VVARQERIEQNLSPTTHTLALMWWYGAAAEESVAALSTGSRSDPNDAQGSAAWLTSA
jgi:hypothetical protein